MSQPDKQGKGEMKKVGKTETIRHNVTVTTYATTNGGSVSYFNRDSQSSSSDTTTSDAKRHEKA